MHFEYRPELIAYAHSHPSKPVPDPPGAEQELYSGKDGTLSGKKKLRNRQANAPVISEFKSNE
jgi:hypothetical protein